MPVPNDSELVILKDLWRSGASSARDIHDRVGDNMNWKLSTTRTVIGRMESKGWISRADASNSVLYQAELERLGTLASIIRHFTKSALGMNGPLPVSMFADSPLLDEDELQELEALINDAEEEEK